VDRVAGYNSDLDQGMCSLSLKRCSSCALAFANDGFRIGAFTKDILFMQLVRLILSCALFADVTIALAADLTPDPGGSRAIVTPAYSWSGYYLGAQIGYARDSTNSQLQTPAGAVLAVWNYNADGVVGGAYSGYNWQLGGFMIGVESDAEGSNLNKTAGPVIGLYSGSKIDWQVSLRTRVGFAVDRSLFYFTGGLADAVLGILFTTPAILLRSTPTVWATHWAAASSRPSPTIWSGASIIGTRTSALAITS
jgi:outer membrane immunogenic protein